MDFTSTDISLTAGQIQRFSELRSYLRKSGKSLHHEAVFQPDILCCSRNHPESGLTPMHTQRRYLQHSILQWLLHVHTASLRNSYLSNRLQNFNLNIHICQFELNGLIGNDRFAECLSEFCIGNGFFHTSLGNTNSH